MPQAGCAVSAFACIDIQYAACGAAWQTGAAAVRPYASARARCTGWARRALRFRRGRLDDVGWSYNALTVQVRFASRLIKKRNQRAFAARSSAVYAFSNSLAKLIISRSANLVVRSYIRLWLDGRLRLWRLWLVGRLRLWR